MIQITENLNSSIYKDSLEIRKKVFVTEQKVPMSLEIEDEEKCIHFVLYQEDIPVATCRLYKKDKKTVKLQRMAVSKEKRKQGYGKKLMQEAEKYADTNDYQTIFLDAQTHALGFYQNLGYQPFGTEFMDAGIPHYSMKKSI